MGSVMASSLYGPLSSSPILSSSVLQEASPSSLLQLGEAEYQKAQELFAKEDFPSALPFLEVAAQEGAVSAIIYLKAIYCSPVDYKHFNPKMVQQVEVMGDIVRLDEAIKWTKKTLEISQNRASYPLNIQQQLMPDVLEAEIEKLQAEYNFLTATSLFEENQFYQSFPYFLLAAHGGHLDAMIFIVNTYSNKNEYDIFDPSLKEKVAKCGHAIRLEFALKWSQKALEKYQSLGAQDIGNPFHISYKALEKEHQELRAVHAFHEGLFLEKTKNYSLAFKKFFESANGNCLDGKIRVLELCGLPFGMWLIRYFANSQDCCENRFEIGLKFAESALKQLEATHLNSFNFASIKTNILNAQSKIEASKKSSEVEEYIYKLRRDAAQKNVLARDELANIHFMWGNSQLEEANKIKDTLPKKQLIQLQVKMESYFLTATSFGRKDAYEHLADIQFFGSDITKNPVITGNLEFALKFILRAKKWIEDKASKGSSPEIDATHARIKEKHKRIAELYIAQQRKLVAFKGPQATSQIKV